MTLILVYAVTTGSFASGFQEKDTVEKNEQKNITEPSFTGTIPVTETKNTNKNGLASQYRDKIIGSQKAESAARVSEPGVGITGISLGTEQGFLVYNVTMNDGTLMVVDAGTGKILYKQKHTVSGSEEEGVERKEEHNDSENG